MNTVYGYQQEGRGTASKYRKFSEKQSIQRRDNQFAII
jgi:hypothetical protein